MNRDMMKYGTLKPILANAQNGTTYATGQLMNFDVPIVAGAYAEKIRIYHDVTFTYTAAGSGPTVSVNAGGQANLFNDVTVNFGNKQQGIHPYVARVLMQAGGYNRTHVGQVLGNQSSSVQTLLYAMPAVAAGANEWKGYTDIPLNLVHPQSPYGLIPIGGSGTRMQVQITTPAGFVGADPLNNVINTNGTITAIGGSVTVVIFYRDYVSTVSPAALGMDLTGLPTAQVIRLRDISPLTAGSPNYLSITNPYPFNKIVSIVIDGQSSSTFCAASNIQAFRVDGAENTSSALRVYDTTNGGMVNYFSRVRELYGQDYDDGVLLYNGNAENTADTSLQDGEVWLNVASNGYPAARLGFQVGTVSSANSITPRVVTYGVLMNPVGIN